MTDQIPLFEIDWAVDDIKNAVDSIGRGGYWAKGPYVSEFESRIESYLGVEHAVTVNSGTTALVAALKAAGIGDGDEVIVPSFTFIATANAVRLADAEPVFADIESQTYGLDPESVRSKITDDTGGILPVHCYGGPCQIETLRSIADEHDLTLVEDAAEVFGAEYGDRKLGSIGDVSALSFCQNKIITTGEGGAVVTDDDEIAKQARLYRSHGRASSDYFDSADSGQYVQVGTNIRMSDLTAAVGCAQIDRVDELIAGRRAAAHRLNDGFEQIDGVSPHTPPAAGTHVYQLYTVELADWVDRQAVIEHLAAQNIDSKVYWDPPIHRTECYQETDTELPVTDRVASRVLSLPIHPNIDSEETDRIGQAVQTAVQRQR